MCIAERVPLPIVLHSHLPHVGCHNRILICPATERTVDESLQEIPHHGDCEHHRNVYRYLHRQQHDTVVVLLSTVIEIIVVCPVAGHTAGHQHRTVGRYDVATLHIHTERDRRYVC